MAAVLKIDGYDFFQYLRVAPGEGFDPAAPGFAEPQFGETVANDAQPLISVNERNKELQWPLHLNAASKDALHTLLIDVNRRLASAQQVEWRDDAATTSTFFEVIFARFDPDYNYRRGQKNWLSGVLRAWVKPYGSTGTYRVVGTGATQLLGLPIFVPLPAASIVGDVEAKVTATQLVYPSQTVVPAGSAMIGFCIIPTTSFGFHPAASLAITISGTRIAESSAVGSQVVRTLLSGLNQERDLTQLGSGPSSIYGNIVAPGRFHVVALLRTQATTAAATRIAISVTDAQLEYNGDSAAISPTYLMMPSTNWEMVDLGVYTQATGAAYLQGINVKAGYIGASAGAVNGPVDCAGIYMLPEQFTVMVTKDALNRVTYNDNFIEGHEDSVQYSIRNLHGMVPRVPVGSMNYKAMFFAHFSKTSQASAHGGCSMSIQERFSYAR